MTMDNYSQIFKLNCITPGYREMFGNTAEMISLICVFLEQWFSNFLSVHNNIWRHNTVDKGVILVCCGPLVKNDRSRCRFPPDSLCCSTSLRSCVVVPPVCPETGPVSSQHQSPGPDAALCCPTKMRQECSCCSVLKKRSYFIQFPEVHL